MAENNKLERKHRDIVRDVNDLLASGAHKLEFALATVAFKYYMTPDSIYNIYNNKDKKSKTNES